MKNKYFLNEKLVTLHNGKCISCKIYHIGQYRGKIRYCVQLECPSPNNKAFRYEDELFKNKEELIEITIKNLDNI